jgi:hypothetical protein
MSGPSPALGCCLLAANLALCYLAVSAAHAASPALATGAAIAATILVTLLKKRWQHCITASLRTLGRIPVALLWPVTGLAVVAQTFSTSSLTSVATTVNMSAM